MMKKIVIILLFFLLNTSLLFANEDIKNKEKKSLKFKDIIAINPQIKKAPAAKKIFFDFSGKMDYKKGNANSLSLAINGNLRYDNNIVKAYADFYLSYSEINAQRFDADGLQIIGCDYSILSFLDLCGIASFSFDHVLGLENRSNFGFGPSLIVLRSDYIYWNIFLAPIFDFEKYKEKEKFEYSTRFFVKSSIRFHPVKKMYFEYTFSYLPDFKNFKNYRLSHLGKVTIEILPKIDFEIGYFYKFDNGIPLIFKNYEHYSFSSLKLKL